MREGVEKVDTFSWNQSNFPYKIQDLIPVTGFVRILARLFSHEILMRLTIPDVDSSLVM